MNGLTQSESTDWMIPSEALNRHIPPLGIVFSDIEENQVQTRYGFTIGPVGCLIAENTLSEVVNNPVIYKLPTLSKILKGVINQRGNIIPVFDLREMLGVNSADSTTRTVLILGQGGKSAGLLIDGLPQTVQVTDELAGALDIPSDYCSFITPAFTNSGRTWAEFDYQQLLLASAACEPGNDADNTTLSDR